MTIISWKVSSLSPCATIETTSTRTGIFESCDNQICSQHDNFWTGLWTERLPVLVTFLLLCQSLQGHLINTQCQDHFSSRADRKITTRAITTREKLFQIPQWFLPFSPSSSSTSRILSQAVALLWPGQSLPNCPWVNNRVMRVGESPGISGEVCVTIQGLGAICWVCNFPFIQWALLWGSSLVSQRQDRGSCQL